jgi:exo-1,4-beta-D-glucosaminidase
MLQPLEQGWHLRSACDTQATAEAISSPGHPMAAWLPGRVPGTVLAAQVAQGQFGDIFHGDNLRRLPGMEQGPKQPTGNPYDCAWWYRTDFTLPAGQAQRRVQLHLNGVNTRAEVWLNGARLAGPEQVAGPYRIVELDATARVAKPGEPNALAIKVTPPGPDDFGIAFVDWTPTPPDKNMGLWREVLLSTSGPVRVRHPAVMTRLPDQRLQLAELTVRAQLHNDADQPVSGLLHVELDGRLGANAAPVRLTLPIALAAHESRDLALTPEAYAALKIARPRLWWPAGLGEQPLHTLRMRFEIDGEVSDAREARFGIRQIDTALHGDVPRPGQVFNNNDQFKAVETDTRPLVVRVNHQPVLIRGAGWAPEMLMRAPRQRLEAEMAYVRDMHLNAIRLEGKLDSDELFDLADRYGILVLAGWTCCDRHEQWDKWTDADLRITTESLRSQLLRLRSHASLSLWMNGSDHHPPPAVEQRYLDILRETAWPNDVVSSATSETTPLTGATGVKMTGPYDYVPPAYWLQDPKRFGGAWGFNTETSPGAAIPVRESLEKFLPPDQLWPRGEQWNFHAGAGEGNKLTRFDMALAKIYGEPADLNDYLRKAQAMAYDGQRAMFEAFGRNKYEATGVIQWMLNNGWPANVWHLYDYYLQPAGGYFGTKKSGEPLHIQYGYDDQGIAVVNHARQAHKGLRATAEVFDIQLKRTFVRSQTLDVPADGVVRLFPVPPGSATSDVYFLRLTLADRHGPTLSHNFYWLPRQTSEIDWSFETQQKHPYYSDVLRWEDLSALQRLPAAQVQARAHVDRGAVGRARLTVTLHNPSKALAFMVRLAAVHARDGHELLPVLWSDNYVALLPGEKRTLSAEFEAGEDVRDLALRVDGWNVPRAVLPVTNLPKRTAISVLHR